MMRNAVGGHPRQTAVPNLTIFRLRPRPTETNVHTRIFLSIIWIYISLSHRTEK